MVFKESETVELKSVVVDDIKKEIIAFANCEGGEIYIGVQDDGTVIGLDDPDGAALQVSNMVRDAIKPDLTMLLHNETLNEDGKQIVAVDIQQGTERLYYIAKKDLPLGEAQMKTLGIMTHDGVYTNLGLLLSDQCVHTIKVAAFEGTTQSQFKDRKEFSGSLFQQMDEVYDYIDFRNQIHSSFQKLYRIEFTSLGGLLSGVTLNDVMMGISVCRNVKLANIFYRLELIEAYGTGMRKIREAYSETGKKPEIKTSENAFKIILPNLNVQTETKKTDVNKPAEDNQEEMIISLAKKQGIFTRKEVQKELGISQTTSGRLLKKMIGNGQIIQEGKGRSTHYRISE